MWNRILGKSNDLEKNPSTSLRRRQSESHRSGPRRSESLKSTTSSRRIAHNEERDRGFDPTSTSYSSTTRNQYPGTASASIGTSFATAPNDPINDQYLPPGLVRNASLANQIPKSAAGAEEPSAALGSSSRSKGEKEEFSSMDRKRERKERRGTRDKDDEKRGSKSSRDSTSRKDSKRGKERAMGTDEIATGSASFVPHAGQYDASRPESLPGQQSSHVQHQFPGQFPTDSAAPYRPPLAASEGGPGLAAEYYGDAGQSVADQPGFRTHSPSLIVGAEPHLQAASAVAAPPQEPSALGGTGAAASFFDGTFSVGSDMEDHHGPKPTTTNGPSATQHGSAAPSASFYAISSSAPTNHHSSSAPVIPTLGAAAAGAAAGYYMGNRPPKQERPERPEHASSSISAYGSIPGSSGYEPMDPSPRPPKPAPSENGTSSISGYGRITGQSAYHHPTGSHNQGASYSSSSRPPAKAGKHSSQSSNIPLYAAGVVGAAGLATATHHHSQHDNHSDITHHNSHSQHYSAGSMAQQHRHRQRGPLSTLVDFFKDPDGVAQFEEYTEYIGVCRHCFAPDSSPRDAPRKHNYRRRRRSNERFGSSVRVDKDSRYSSSENENRRRRNKSWLGAGIAGYGLGTMGEHLFKQDDDSHTVYSGKVKRSRRRGSSSSSDRKSRTSQGRAHRSRDTLSHKSRSNGRMETGITGDGKLYRKDAHGTIHTSTARSDISRHRSRSRSRDRTSRFSEAALGAAIGSSLVASTSRRRSSRSPKNAFIRSKHDNDSRSELTSVLKLHDSEPYDGHHRSRHSPDSPYRKGGRKEKKKRGFFTFSNGSSSSSGSSNLAFGAGHERRSTKNTQSKKKDKSSKDADAAILGLGAAAAAALALSQNQRSRHRGELIAVKESKGKSKPAKRESKGKKSSPSSEEDLWESASEGEWSSADSELAYGASMHRRSQESLSSDSSGLDKWSWRWGSKKQSRRPKEDRRRFPGHDHVSQAAAPQATDLIGSQLPAEGNWQDSRTTSNSNVPLQHVYPMPTSDPTQYDVARHDAGFASHLSYINARPDPVPIQHPQPVAPVSPAVYTTQTPHPHTYSAPTGPPSLPQYEYPTAVVSRDAPIHQDKRAPGAFPIGSEYTDSLVKDPKEDSKARRRDSSPVMRTSENTPTYSGARRRKSLKDDASSVRFDLTKEQEDKDRREERRRRKEQDKELERLEREEVEHRKVAEQDRLSKREATSRTGSGRDPIEQPVQVRKESWAAPAAAGVIAAAIGATVAAKGSVEDEHRRGDDDERPKDTEERDIEVIVRERHAPTGIAASEDKQRRGRSSGTKPMSVWQAAAKIKRPSSHTEYAAYFTPPELLEKDSDVKQIIGPNADNDITVYQVPRIVTVEPSAPQGHSISRAYSFPISAGDREHGEKSLPWSVPQLNLVEPTPPSSRSGSVAGSRSPHSRSPLSKEIAAEIPLEPLESVNDVPVTFTVPEHVEYTVIEPKGRSRPSVDSPVDDSNVPQAVPGISSLKNRRKRRDSPPRVDYGDDLDFAATVAAGLQDTGLDPSIVVDDPSFRRRESPPGSEADDFSRGPTATVVEITDTIAGPRSPPHGFAEEVPELHMPGSFDAEEERTVSPFANPNEEDRLTEEATGPSDNVDANPHVYSVEPVSTEPAAMNNAAVDPVGDVSYGKQKATESEMTPKELTEPSDDSRVKPQVYTAEPESFEPEGVREMTADSAVDNQRTVESEDEPLRIQPTTEESAYSSPDKVDYPSDEAPSVAATAPVVSSSSQSSKSKKKSKRRSVGFDDTTSVISAPTTFEDTKDSRAKPGKSRKGGIFGIFSRSTESLPESNGSRETPVEAELEDFEEPKKRSKKSKDRKAALDDDEAVSGATDHTASQEPEAQEDWAPSKKSKRGKEKRRSSEHDSGRITQDLPAQVIPPASPPRNPLASLNQMLTKLKDPKADHSLFEPGANIGVEAVNDRSQAYDDQDPSFLGGRPEKPPLPNLPDASEDPGGQMELEQPIQRSGESPGTKADKQKWRLSDLHLEDRSVSHSSPSPTAVPLRPLRFGRRPSSPGLVKSLPSTPQPPTSADLPFTPRRRERPHSTEFKSNEFRPIWLLEKHGSRQEPAPLETYPSLPSSHTTSRASSVHEADGQYHMEGIGFSTGQPSDQFVGGDRGLAIDTGYSIPESELLDSELLDSQQATPTAASFHSMLHEGDSQAEETRSRASSPHVDSAGIPSTPDAFFDPPEEPARDKRLLHDIHDLFPQRRSPSPSRYDLGLAEELPRQPEVKLSAHPEASTKEDSGVLSILKDVALGAIIGGSTAALLKSSSQHDEKLEQTSDKAGINDVFMDEEGLAPTPVENVPGRPTTDEVQLLQEQDAQDAVDSWFTSPQPKRPKSKKGKKRSESLEAVASTLVPGPAAELSKSLVVDATFSPEPVEAASVPLPETPRGEPDVEGANKDWQRPLLNRKDSKGKKKKSKKKSIDPWEDKSVLADEPTAEQVPTLGSGQDESLQPTEPAAVEAPLVGAIAPGGPEALSTDIEVSRDRATLPSSASQLEEGDEEPVTFSKKNKKGKKKNRQLSLADPKSDDSPQGSTAAQPTEEAASIDLKIPLGQPILQTLSNAQGVDLNKLVSEEVPYDFPPTESQTPEVEDVPPMPTEEPATRGSTTKTNPSIAPSKQPRPDAAVEKPDAQQLPVQSSPPGAPQAETVIGSLIFDREILSSEGTIASGPEPEIPPASIALREDDDLDLVEPSDSPILQPIDVVQASEDAQAASDQRSGTPKQAGQSPEAQLSFAFEAPRESTEFGNLAAERVVLARAISELNLPENAKLAEPFPSNAGLSEQKAEVLEEQPGEDWPTPLVKKSKKGKKARKDKAAEADTEQDVVGVEAPVAEGIERQAFGDLVMGQGLHEDRATPETTPTNLGDAIVMPESSQSVDKRFTEPTAEEEEWPNMSKKKKKSKKSKKVQFDEPQETEPEEIGAAAARNIPLATTSTADDVQVLLHRSELETGRQVAEETPAVQPAFDIVLADTPSLIRDQPEGIEQQAAVEKGQSPPPGPTDSVSAPEQKPLEVVAGQSSDTARQDLILDRIPSPSERAVASTGTAAEVQDMLAEERPTETLSSPVEQTVDDSSRPEETDSAWAPSKKKKKKGKKPKAFDDVDFETPEIPQPEMSVHSEPSAPTEVAPSDTFDDFPPKKSKKDKKSKESKPIDEAASADVGTPEELHPQTNVGVEMPIAEGIAADEPFEESSGKRSRGDKKSKRKGLLKTFSDGQGEPEPGRGPDVAEPVQTEEMAVVHDAPSVLAISQQLPSIEVPASPEEVGTEVPNDSFAEAEVDAKSKQPQLAQEESLLSPSPRRGATAVEVPSDAPEMEMSTNAPSVLKKHDELPNIEMPMSPDPVLNDGLDTVSYHPIPTPVGEEVLRSWQPLHDQVPASLPEPEAGSILQVEAPVASDPKGEPTFVVDPLVHETTEPLPPSESADVPQDPDARSTNQPIEAITDHPGPSAADLDDPAFEPPTSKKNNKKSKKAQALAWEEEAPVPASEKKPEVSNEVLDLTEEAALQPAIEETPATSKKDKKNLKKAKTAAWDGDGTETPAEMVESAREIEVPAIDQPLESVIADASVAVEEVPKSKKDRKKSKKAKALAWEDDAIEAPIEVAETQQELGSTIGEEPLVEGTLAVEEEPVPSKKDKKRGKKAKKLALENDEPGSPTEDPEAQQVTEKTAEEPAVRVTEEPSIVEEEPALSKKDKKKGKKATALSWEENAPEASTLFPEAGQEVPESTASHPLQPVSEKTTPPVEEPAPSNKDKKKSKKSKALSWEEDDIATASNEEPQQQGATYGELEALDEPFDEVADPTPVGEEEPISKKGKKRCKKTKFADWHEEPSTTLTTESTQPEAVSLQPKAIAEQPTDVEVAIDEGTTEVPAEEASLKKGKKGKKSKSMDWDEDSTVASTPAEAAGQSLVLGEGEAVAEPLEGVEGAVPAEAVEVQDEPSSSKKGKKKGKKSKFVAWNDEPPIPPPGDEPEKAQVNSDLQDTQDIANVPPRGEAPPLEDDGFLANSPKSKDNTKAKKSEAPAWEEEVPAASFQDLDALDTTGDLADQPILPVKASEAEVLEMSDEAITSMATEEPRVEVPAIQSREAQAVDYSLIEKAQAIQNDPPTPAEGWRADEEYKAAVALDPSREPTPDNESSHDIPTLPEHPNSLETEPASAPAVDDALKIAEEVIPILSEGEVAHPSASDENATHALREPSPTLATTDPLHVTEGQLVPSIDDTLATAEVIPPASQEVAVDLSSLPRDARFEDSELRSAPTTTGTLESAEEKIAPSVGEALKTAEEVIPPISEEPMADSPSQHKDTTEDHTPGPMPTAADALQSSEDRVVPSPELDLPADVPKELANATLVPDPESTDTVEVSPSASKKEKKKSKKAKRTMDWDDEAAVATQDPDLAASEAIVPANLEPDTSPSDPAIVEHPIVPAEPTAADAEEDFFPVGKKDRKKAKKGKKATAWDDEPNESIPLAASESTADALPEEAVASAPLDTAEAADEFLSTSKKDKKKSKKSKKSLNLGVDEPTLDAIPTEAGPAIATLDQGAEGPYMPEPGATEITDALDELSSPTKKDKKKSKRSKKTIHLDEDEPSLTTPAEPDPLADILDEVTKKPSMPEPGAAEFGEPSDDIFPLSKKDRKKSKKNKGPIVFEDELSESTTPVEADLSTVDQEQAIEGERAPEPGAAETAEPVDDPFPLSKKDKKKSEKSKKTLEFDDEPPESVTCAGPDLAAIETVEGVAAALDAPEPDVADTAEPAEPVEDSIALTRKEKKKSKKGKNENAFGDEPFESTSPAEPDVHAAALQDASTTAEPDVAEAADDRALIKRKDKKGKKSREASTFDDEPSETIMPVELDPTSEVVDDIAQEPTPPVEPTTPAEEFPTFSKKGKKAKKSKKALTFDDEPSGATTPREEIIDEVAEQPMLAEPSVPADDFGPITKKDKKDKKGKKSRRASTFDDEPSGTSTPIELDPTIAIIDQAAERPDMLDEPSTFVDEPSSTGKKGKKAKKSKKALTLDDEASGPSTPAELDPVIEIAGVVPDEPSASLEGFPLDDRKGKKEGNESKIPPSFDEVPSETIIPADTEPVIEPLVREAEELSLPVEPDAAGSEDFLAMSKKDRKKGKKGRKALAFDDEEQSGSVAPLTPNPELEVMGLTKEPPLTAAASVPDEDFPPMSKKDKKKGKKAKKVSAWEAEDPETIPAIEATEAAEDQSQEQATTLPPMPEPEHAQPIDSNNPGSLPTPRSLAEAVLEDTLDREIISEAEPELPASSKKAKKDKKKARKTQAFDWNDEAATESSKTDVIPVSRSPVGENQDLGPPVDATTTELPDIMEHADPVVVRPRDEKEPTHLLDFEPLLTSHTDIELAPRHEPPAAVQSPARSVEKIVPQALSMVEEDRFEPETFKAPMTPPPEDFSRQPADVSIAPTAGESIDHPTSAVERQEVEELAPLSAQEPATIEDEDFSSFATTKKSKKGKKAKKEPIIWEDDTATPPPADRDTIPEVDKASVPAAASSRPEMAVWPTEVRINQTEGFAREHDHAGSLGEAIPDPVPPVVNAPVDIPAGPPAVVEERSDYFDRTPRHDVPDQPRSPSQRAHDEATAAAAAPYHELAEGPIDQQGSNAGPSLSQEVAAEPSDDFEGLATRKKGKKSKRKQQKQAVDDVMWEFPAMNAPLPPPPAGPWQGIPVISDPITDAQLDREIDAELDREMQAALTGEQPIFVAPGDVTRGSLSQQVKPDEPSIPSDGQAKSQDTAIASEQPTVEETVEDEWDPKPKKSKKGKKSKKNKEVEADQVSTLPTTSLKDADAPLPLRDSPPTERGTELNAPRQDPRQPEHQPSEEEISASYHAEGSAAIATAVAVGAGLVAADQLGRKESKKSKKKKTSEQANNTWTEPEEASVAVAGPQYLVENREDQSRAMTPERRRSSPIQAWHQYISPSQSPKQSELYDVEGERPRSAGSARSKRSYERERSQVPTPERQSPIEAWHQYNTPRHSPQQSETYDYEGRQAKDEGGHASLNRANRDSAVHVSDSPIVPQQSPIRRVIRDSGYPDTEASPVVGIESEHQDYPLQHSTYESTYHDVGVPTDSLPQVRSFEDLREPSPVSSTTKDRSSLLFQSSPSTREEHAQREQREREPHHQEAVDRQEQDYDRHDRHGHQAVSPSLAALREENTAKVNAQAESLAALSGLRSPDQDHPRPSIFGGPLGISSDTVSPETSLDHDGASRRRLNTITEYSPEESPLHNRNRELSDVGSPVHGVKTARRSRTPQAISKRRARSSSAAEQDKDVMSADDLTAGDDEKHYLDIERSRSRGTDQRPSSYQSNISSLVSSLPKQREYERRSLSGASNHSVESINAIIRTPPDQMRSASGMSNRSSGTPPLRRTDRSVSGDLRGANRKSEAKKRAKQPEAESEIAAPPLPSTTPDPSNERRKSRVKDMASVYEGYGDFHGSPISPTRPPSMRRRQSMQVLELESKLDQLASENRLLHDARQRVEREMEDAARNQGQEVESYREGIATRDTWLRQKDTEISELKNTLGSLQSQVAHLTQVNEGLHASSRALDEHQERYGQLEEEHAETYQRWQESKRELEALKDQHAQLSAGMEDIVRHEVSIAVSEKDAELHRLQSELETAKQQIRTLQAQVLASKKNASSDSIIPERDEDYFDAQCQSLCSHVQQWVLRFSKFSDNRACYLASEISDEKIVDRMENAILDGSDPDDHLADRVKRRDVFMSMVMTMTWEFIFTRYLFGADREQRQKLKTLEKQLSESTNVPMSAVHRWRATTLALLSKREAFVKQRAQDTEAVMHTIYDTLATILPPPSHLVPQIQQSLRKVLATAVDLSIEMRTQKAEYVMLPPLQPEYDTNGDLARKVYFNAALMNERSGSTTVGNEELEARQAVVRMVLFPLVVKKGDGEEGEEIVVCPAQVLVKPEGGDRKGKSVRVVSAQGSRSAERPSAPVEGDVAMGNMF
ncbi:MAG: hypothetical protein Q9207_004237 [Kuettlingeria erythrocarpa]